MLDENSCRRAGLAGWHEHRKHRDEYEGIGEGGNKRTTAQRFLIFRSSGTCTFDLGDVRVVFASAAYVFDFRGDILETLSAILGVPLRGRPFVRAQLVNPGTAGPPLRQALLRGESREGGDRTGLAPVTLHAVTMTLISRVLEDTLLAGSPAGLRQAALLNDRGIAVAARADRTYAFPDSDFLEFHDLGAVQLAFLHQPLEALLERRVACSGRWSPVRWRPERRPARVRVLQEILGAGTASARPDLFEKAHPVPQPATTWRSRTATTIGAAAAGAVYPRRGRTTSGWCRTRHIQSSSLYFIVLAQESSAGIVSSLQCQPVSFPLLSSHPPPMPENSAGPTPVFPTPHPIHWVAYAAFASPAPFR